MCVYQLVNLAELSPQMKLVQYEDTGFSVTLKTEFYA